MTETTKSSWLPSLGDILFLLILQLLLGLLPNYLYGDGSTGWHLVTGHYILDHGQIPRTDLISNTFPDKQWVAYEWLFDAGIALLEKLGGLDLVAVACSSAIALLFLLIYQDCRRSGAHYLTSMILCMIGALVSAVHWLVRPHLVTFFGVYCFSRLLDAYYQGRIQKGKLCLCLAACMLVWVNCHPAFLIGFAVVVIYLVCDAGVALFAAGSSDSGQEARNRLKGLALALATVVAVSFLNPYGTELYRYIWEYLHQTQVIRHTDEFKSPSFQGALQPALLEVMFFALVVSLAASARRPNLPRLLTVLSFAHLALAGVRSMPLFAIVAVPFIAEMTAHARLSSLLSGANLAPARWIEGLVRLWRSTGETIDGMEFLCRRHALPVSAVAILSVSCLFGGSILGVSLVDSGFDPILFPTETLKYLREHRLDPSRGLSFDNWGGYLRYKTGQRVFIDDRVDFYGEEFYLDYAQVSTVRGNWRKVLDTHNINWILFPRNQLLSEVLRQQPGWEIACQDAASYLFVRKAQGRAAVRE